MSRGSWPSSGVTSTMTAMGMASPLCQWPEVAPHLPSVRAARLSVREHADGPMRGGGAIVSVGRPAVAIPAQAPGDPERPSPITRGMTDHGGETFIECIHAPDARGGGGGNPAGAGAGTRHQPH